MASADNRPSQSLINAALGSLIGNHVMAAVEAGRAVPAITAGGPLSLVPYNITRLYYGRMIPAVTADGQNIPRETLEGPIPIDMKCLAPEFDYDFTDEDDDDETFLRGNQPYQRPCGSYRIALKVKDKFGTNNDWLGMTGTAPGEWPVSYHGTAKHNAMNIAEEGYKLSKGKRFLFGKGIYSTPELKVAKYYATKFKHEGSSYLCILQNRINPKYLEVIPKSENGVGTYWLSAGDREEIDEKELLRPYGICLFKEN